MLGKIDLLLSIFRQPFLWVTWDWKQAEGQVERCFFPDAIYTLRKQRWHVLGLYSWIHIVCMCTCILKWGCPRKKDLVFFPPPPTLSWFLQIWIKSECTFFFTLSLILCFLWIFAVQFCFHKFQAMLCFLWSMRCGFHPETFQWGI